ncbi:MAG: DEAD/DEAH box helicase [Candidatus Omnitrophica bacterium]|nr:DEAD/DEAH box helicase [Candidatus Omnitrophota bacterium]
MKLKKEHKKTVKLSRTHKPDELTVEEWQRALRREFGVIQKFRLKNLGGEEVFSEFAVMNPETKRTYRVAVRSERPGENFCSCPDFSVNTLGTCKHVEFVLYRLRKNRRRRELLAAGASLPYSEVFLRYGSSRRVLFKAGAGAPTVLKSLAADYFDRDHVLQQDSFQHFDAFLEKARALDHDMRCYDDALAFIAEIQEAHHRRTRLAAVFPDGIKSAAFDSLLKVPLYPYQREGALFAVHAGRALIADEMGLGKTVQAIAAAEIFAREFGVRKALIVCPTSLKHQWKDEIQKFCGRSVAVVEGMIPSRREVYRSEAFFVVVNYDVVFRDSDLINQMSPDIVILDEAQRIKNWKTRTARSVKGIQSPHAIVLTGTPLENRLEELHSIVGFVDRFRLGPLFRFLGNHQQTAAETGKVTGYRDLKAIGRTLQSILIRRKKSEVLLQLPERMDKNFFVPMTPEQMNIHEENREIVARIAAKWSKYRFLTEADQRRMTIALQFMRMSCDNAYLIDRKLRSGGKVDELVTLLGEIFEERDAKAVVFSQWERMTSLVSEAFHRKSWGHVHLHGGVPGPKRKDLIKAFRDDPSCRVFLSTDAGGVGLNLQAASTVINMDLPWNPAVLEQRIGRVHRLGQHRPVRVVNFIAERTIEHHMLSILKFKKALFAGVLDGGEDSIFIGKSRLSAFMESIQELSKPSNGDSDVGIEGASKEAIRPLLVETAKKPGGDGFPYQDIFAAGASFFKVLAAGLEKQPVTLEKDAATGRSCLKVPLPDQEIMRGALPAVESFLGALKSYIKMGDGT